MAELAATGWIESVGARTPGLGSVIHSLLAEISPGYTSEGTRLDIPLAATEVLEVCWRMWGAWAGVASG